MNAVPPPPEFDDNPAWTDEDFARARPAAEVLPAVVAAALVRKPGGRPPGSNKEQVSLRLDKDALARWRATGPGWQSRMNDALRHIPVAAEQDLMGATRAQGNGARWQAMAA